MELSHDERRLLARVLHGFDDDDGRAAREILRDHLLERDHPWGAWMAECSPRNTALQRAVERGVYAGMNRVLTKKDRKWDAGFLVGGRLRAKHLDELLDVQSDPLWLVMESLTLAPNQGDRIADVARFVGRTPWCRLRHLALDDARFVAPLVDAGFPATLESLYLWSLGGVPAERLARAIPPSVKRLHVQVFQLLDESGVAPLFARDWESVEVDIAHPWLRDLAAGRVEQLDLHTASFSLSGTARDTGFDWTIRRHFPDVEHHLWRFVERWPVHERDQVCPERPPRVDPREWW
ncbi:MAG: hypothetical protein H6737_15805 [Alphaproteobacteria bacterium]|nr:hypothetical protein [Alphaproteobacteria bacterium]